MKTQNRSKKILVITLLSGGLLAAGAAGACWKDRGPDRDWRGGWHHPMGKHDRDFCMFHKSGKHAKRDMRGPMSQGPMMRGGGFPFSEQRLGMLKQRLNIQPAQENAWNQFTGTMQELQKTREARFTARREMRQKMRNLPLDQRLKQRTAMMQQRMQNMQKASQAIGNLYASLDDNQRQIMNGIRLPMMRH